MKKLFILFTLLFLVVGISACSSDDGDGVGIPKDLFLKADRNRINENESVTFTAIDSDSKVIDVELFIDGVKISKKHKFENRGIYIVTAKKAGYKISSPLAIQVIKEGELVTRVLELKANKYEVEIGEEIKFTVTDGLSPIDAVYIHYLDSGATVPVEWEPNLAGEFKLVAKKPGYFDSNVITVKVKQKTVQPKKNFVIKGTNFNINLVQMAVATDAKYNPLLFHEEINGEIVNYYVFNINYSENREDYISYTMKVMIPKGTTELILPFNTDKKNVIPWDVMTVLKAEKVQTFEPSELATHVIEYVKPFVEGVSPGTLKTSIKTKDGKNSVDFEGEYTGLHGNIIIDTGKNYNSKITSTPVPTKVEILRK